MKEAIVNMEEIKKIYKLQLNLKDLVNPKPQIIVLAAMPVAGRHQVNATNLIFLTFSIIDQIAKNILMIKYIIY